MEKTQLIYVLNLGTEVILGGTVASATMLTEGWRPYYGKVPVGNKFKFDANGWLVVKEED